MPDVRAKTRSRLENLKALEVSCVEKGANGKPWFIIKNEDGRVPQPDIAMSIPERLSPTQAEAFNAYVAWRDSQVQKDAGSDSQLLGNQQKATLQSIYRMILPLADSLNVDDLVAMAAQAGLQGTEDVDDGMGEDNPIDVDQGDPERVLQSEASMDKKVAKDADWQIPKPETASDAEHSKASMAAKSAYAKAMGKTDKAMDDEEDDEDMEPMDKSKDKDCVTKSADMAPEHQAYFADVQKKHEALITKCAELEGTLHTMRNAEVLKSIESKLETELPHLSMDRAKTAQVLKSLGDVSKEQADAYMATLKAAHEQVAVTKSYNGAGLYGSTRAPQNFAATSGSASERFSTMVSDYIAKSGSQDASKAFSEVIKNPEAQRLYEQSCMEGTK